MDKFILATHKGLYITISCFLLASSVCSPAPSAIATSTPSVTVTLIPTLTNTPAPAATIQPSATPIPSAIPTSLVADLGQVIFSENFDDPEFPFDVYGPQRIESGVLVLEREKGYQPPPEMWPTNGLYGIAPVDAGVTTIILFKVTGDIDFNIGYHTGDYGTETLRRFSFNSASGTWNLFEGKSTSPVRSWNARSPRSNAWHYFSITRSANGDMDARLWESDKPETMFQFQGNLGSEWGKIPLTFVVDFREGTFTLDEYQDLQ